MKDRSYEDITERINLMQGFSPSSGYVVLDSSVFSLMQFFQPQDLRLKTSPTLLDTEIEFVRGLRKLFREQERFVFADPVLEEYQCMTNAFRKLNGPGAQKGLQRLIIERNIFFKDLRPLQSVISDETAAFLPIVERAVRSRSRAFYAVYPNLHMIRMHKPSSLKDHAENDERILAHAYTVTYEHPMRVVSADSDFDQIYAAAFVDPAYLLTEGLPTLPTCAFQVCKAHPRFLSLELVTSRHLREHMPFDSYRKSR